MRSFSSLAFNSVSQFKTQMDISTKLSAGKHEMSYMNVTPSILLNFKIVIYASYVVTNSLASEELKRRYQLLPCTVMELALLGLTSSYHFIAATCDLVGFPCY